MALSIKPLMERAENARQDIKNTNIDLHLGTRFDERGHKTVGAAVVLKVDRNAYDHLKTMATRKRSKRSKQAHEGGQVQDQAQVAG
jgi:hypothetical protein